MVKSPLSATSLTVTWASLLKVISPITKGGIQGRDPTSATNAATSSWDQAPSRFTWGDTLEKDLTNAISVIEDFLKVETSRLISKLMKKKCNYLDTDSERMIAFKVHLFLNRITLSKIREGLLRVKEKALMMKRFLQWVNSRSISKTLPQLTQKEDRLKIQPFLHPRLNQELSTKTYLHSSATIWKSPIPRRSYKKIKSTTLSILNHRYLKSNSNNILISYIMGITMLKPNLCQMPLTCLQDLPLYKIKLKPTHQRDIALGSSNTQRFKALEETPWSHKPMLSTHQWIPITWTSRILQTKKCNILVSTLLNFHLSIQRPEAASLVAPILSNPRTHTVNSSLTKIIINSKISVACRRFGPRINNLHIFNMKKAVLFISINKAMELTAVLTVISITTARNSRHSKISLPDLANLIKAALA